MELLSAASTTAGFRGSLLGSLDPGMMTETSTPEIAHALVGASPVSGAGAEELSRDTERRSYTFSQTWISPHEREYEKFLATNTTLHRIAPQSSVIPTSFADWLHHRIAAIQSEKEEAERKLVLMRDLAGTATIAPALGGRELSENRGTVLCLETIWCDWGMGRQRKSAPWPSLQEMKWEGDDRAKTGVHRFPPIPREPGNATVAWHQLRAIKALEFDQVRKVPTMEDMDGYEEVDTSAMHLIDSTLLAEIDR